MENYQNRKDRPADKTIEKEQVSENSAYPDAVENMSSKWRSIQQGASGQDQRGFFERHYLILGLFIGLLIFALLIVFGGFAFLVWNAH